MDWKGILEKVVVAVIAGAILAVGTWLFTRNFNDPQQVRIDISWIDVDNPLYRLPTQQRDKMSESIKLFTGLNFDFLNSNTTYSDKMRISSVSISNVSDVKSQQIELQTEFGFFIGRSDIMTFDQDIGRVKIRQLNPNETVSITLISSFIFQPPQIKGLHDNRSVRVSYDTVNDFIPAYKYAVISFPFLVYVFSSMGAVTIIVLLISFFYSLFVKDKIAWQAKNLSKNSTLNHFEIVKYITENLPENVPYKFRGGNKTERRSDQSE